MRFPKSITVLGRKFKVRYVDRIAIDSQALGITYPFDQRIEIAALSHDTEAQILTTLLHETLHAALHVSGLSVGMSETGEESLVTLLTYAVEEITPQLEKIKRSELHNI